MPGLEPKRQANGIYHAHGSVAGKRIRQSLGTRSEPTARELCAHLEAKHWKRHNYGEAAVRLFEEAAISYMQQGGEAQYLAPLIKYFKGRTVGTITPGEIRAAAMVLYPDAGPATKNRHGITPARAVILHAHDLGWCGAIKVKQFEVPKSRKHKPVDRAWLQAFMGESDKSKLPHISAAVMLMHQNGVRVSEALNAAGEHFDAAGRTVVLAKTKTSEWSVRHLTAELTARVAALNPKEGHRIFGLKDPKAFNRTIKRIATRAGIEPLSTHSVGRHSFATNAINLGNSIKDTMDAGDWKSAKLFMETYVHSHEAGQNVAAKFDQQTGPIDMLWARSLKRRRAAPSKA